MAQWMIAYVCSRRIWKDTRGQDLMEYAMYVAAILLLYTAFSPSVAAGVVHIISKIDANLSAAAQTS